MIKEQTVPGTARRPGASSKLPGFVAGHMRDRDIKPIFSRLSLRNAMRDVPYDQCARLANELNPMCALS